MVPHASGGGGSRGAGVGVRIPRPRLEDLPQIPDNKIKEERAEDALTPPQKCRDENLSGAPREGQSAKRDEGRCADNTCFLQ